MRAAEAAPRIAPLDASALPRLLEIEALSFSAADGPLSKRAFRQHLKDGSVLLGAWLDGADKAPEVLSGYALGLVRPTRIRLYSLAVDPAFRGRGVARALTLAVIGAARERGLEEVSLEVRAGNQAALSLYQSLGFQLDRVRPDYYGEGLDGHRLLLALD